jgi:hypothetical protein
MVCYLVKRKTGHQMVFHSPVKHHKIQVNGALLYPKKDETYSTTEADPVIFTTERFYGLHTVPNRILALLAFRRAEPNVARLAVRITLVDGETDVIVLKLAVAFECDGSGTLTDLTIDARGQERVATLGTEKVLLVVRAFSEFRVVKGDETFVDDRRFAVITTRSETL